MSLNRVMSKISVHSKKNFPTDFFNRSGWVGPKMYVPKFSMVPKPKKRSNSENRRRQIDFASNRDDDYFTNKLKGTLKNPVNAGEEAFFTKRKWNQKFHSERKPRPSDDQVRFQKAFTAKIQEASGRVSRQGSGSRFSSRIESGNKGVVVNLNTKKFQNFAKVGNNIVQAMPVRHYSESSLLSWAQSTSSVTDSDAKYHCTFFPKGKFWFVGPK